MRLLYWLTAEYLVLLRAVIWFIGIDRPGIGLFSFQPGRMILDFLSDVEALADALGIEEFSLTAVSTGSPYLFACLHKLPRRVSSCAIIAGVPPVLELGADKMPKESRIFISIAQKFPCLIHSPKMSLLLQTVFLAVCFVH